MNVLIVGYGRMGKEVEKILLKRNHKIVSRIDNLQGAGDGTQILEKHAKEADIAIEFSLKDAVLKNAEIYSKYKLRAVVGTTGFEADLEKIKELVLKSGIGYLYGSNFSIGAHILFNLTKTVSHIIESIPDYDIMVNELHHNKKKDSPSGTALTLGNIILKNNSRKKKIITDTLNRQIEPDELHIGSARCGSIPGIHNVIIDSEFDTIEISHNVRSRSCLALGAVMAAEWLNGKNGFLTVDDFISSILK